MFGLFYFKTSFPIEPTHDANGHEVFLERK